jgi:hypothetical protein
VEDAMLKPENIEEIFLAFIGTGDLVPSQNLLAALAETTGKTEAELHEQYKRFAQSITDSRADPFER